MSETTSQVPFAPPPSEGPSAAPAIDSQPVASPERRLRLWPAVVLVVVQWLVILVPGWVAPVTMAHFMGWFLGSLLGALGLALWWLLASRLRWADRWLGLAAFLGLGAATFPFWDESLRDSQSNGLFFLVIWALPVVTTAWVAWLVATPFLRWPVRRAGLLVVLLLAWGAFLLARTDGTYGSMKATFYPRWSPTEEQRFLALMAAGKLGSKSAVDAAAVPPAALQPGDWPAFRGPGRDGRLTGVRIATDWDQNPPRLVWRHRVGPGWSSFAMVGNRLYTQEQRGPDEVVVCYDADSGAERWSHKDPARFTETMAGPGPRATPTFHEGKVYALGATGRLNCLDAVTGRLLWPRDIVADTGAKVPQWGFAASPLVAQGVVAVFAGAEGGKSVVGYDAATGKPAWFAGEGQFSYCSPQPARLGGVEQLLIATDQGLTAIAPAGGAVLWRHDWPLPGEMSRIVQPALVGEGDVLLGTGFGKGTRRVRVSHAGERWSTEAVWTSRALKPYYNDMVVHRGQVYGFDNAVLTCVSLEDGQEKWRARGYGNGQVLLLADQDLLLVLSEQGAVALVDAVPDGHRERARFQALDGKTWNHPVVAHGKLFVRNGAEAACYELAPESGASAAR
jgi:outer membrane protein assembly factor BamB